MDLSCARSPRHTNHAVNSAALLQKLFPSRGQGSTVAKQKYLGYYQQNLAACSVPKKRCETFLQNNMGEHVTRHAENRSGTSCVLLEVLPSSITSMHGTASMPSDYRRLRPKQMTGLILPEARAFVNPTGWEKPVRLNGLWDKRTSMCKALSTPQSRVGIFIYYKEQDVMIW